MLAILKSVDRVNTSYFLAPYLSFTKFIQFYHYLTVDRKGRRRQREQRKKRTLEKIVT